MIFSKLFGKKEKMVRCEKCGKEKKESEGSYRFGGSTFCCKQCCGDTSRGEHKEKDAKTCEFC